MKRKKADGRPLTSKPVMRGGRLPEKVIFSHRVSPSPAAGEPNR